MHTYTQISYNDIELYECCSCVNKLKGNPNDWDQEELDKLKLILPGEYLEITGQRLLAKEKSLNEQHKRATEKREAELQNMHAKYTMELQQKREETLAAHTKDVNKFNFEKEQILKETEMRQSRMLQKHKELMLQRELEHESVLQEKKHELALLQVVAKENEKKFESDQQQQEAELKFKEFEVDNDEKERLAELERKMEEDEKQLNSKLEKESEIFESLMKAETEDMMKSAEETFTSRVVAEVEFIKADGSKLTISETEPGGLASQIIRDHGLHSDDDLT